jgi:hypothetical protein
MKLLCLLAAMAAVAVTASAAPSAWVFYGSDGKLHYQVWTNGNRIMDFSHAGYMDGGVALPTVATVQTLNPSGGDDSTALQNAINSVAAQPLVNGFRGALQLGAGTFRISKQININASGVVLRGAGSATGGTTLLMTNASSFTLFHCTGSGSRSESGKVSITGSFVPSGTDTFTVSDATGFNVGDTVVVGRTVTAAWIHLLGMDTLVRNGATQTWISAGSVIKTDRVIKQVSGNQITLDAPLTDSFDSTYLGTPVGTMSHYTWSTRISQVGLEHLRIQAPPVASGYGSIYMDAIIDSWLRDIAIQDGVNNVNLDNNAKRCTVDTVVVKHTVVQTSSAAPTDYSVTGTEVLLNKCQSSGTGSWPYVTSSKGTGPIVLLNCSSTQDRGVAPHERWTTGILSDNCQFPNAQSSGSKEGIAYGNRGTDGSGHGWTTGWSVGWNVTSPFLLADAAPGTENWCIGGVGAKGSSSDPHGIYESLGAKVDLGQTGSLYLEQLRERLGDQALANIGYGSAPAPDFSLAASPASVTIVQGSSGTSTVTETDLNGYSGTVSLSASGLPAGVTASFNPVSTTSTSTLTLTAGASAATGSAAVTITGTDGTRTHTTTVNLTVNPAPDFSLSASPASLTVTQGFSGTSTITETDLNGYAGIVSLSASGLPAGVTANFNPVNTTGTSTLTLTASGSAATGTATVTITGTDGTLTHTTAVALTVNASGNGPLPTGWTDGDIGAVGRAGSAGFNGGTFTVSGGGADIFNTGDQFNYARQSVSGDVTIVARVVTESSTASFAKAGVMIRETLATNSVNASVLLTPTNGISMEIRPTTGAATINVSGWIKGVLPPQWVKLVRAGSTFTGFYSADGVAWTQIASTNLTMAAGATAGLAVTAHDNASLNTATFDNVSITANAIDTTAIYQIQNVASGLVLNQQGSLTNGSKITQWTTGSTSQNLQWKFIATSNGYYQINSVKSGLDAAVQSASTANGAGIVQWAFGSSGNDQWKPVANGDGTYTIFNLHSGLVLEDPGSSTSTATQMDQWATTGGANQKWKLLPQ